MQIKNEVVPPLEHPRFKIKIKKQLFDALQNLRIEFDIF